MAEDILRAETLALLEGVGAHMPFDEAVRDFPDHAINQLPPGVPYTPWQLLEHVRFTQADILDYVRNRSYQAPNWPDDYWPAPGSEASPDQFRDTVARFRADREALRAIVEDPSTDLLATIPGTPGHTILREVRLVGDHNAYHIGEFAILRQVMRTWPAGREE